MQSGYYPSGLESSATVNITPHHLNWRPGAGCSQQGGMANNCSHYLLTRHFIKLNLVLNFTSNPKCFCNKVSGTLSYVLCCRICLKEKWKSQSLNCILDKTILGLTPILCRKKRELGLSFYSGACLLKQSGSSKSQSTFLSSFLLTLYFSIYWGGTYQDETAAATIKVLMSVVSWFC